MAFNKRYNPSLDDLRGSLRMRSKELFLENSLHGVPYFADPTRPIHERQIHRKKKDIANHYFLNIIYVLLLRCCFFVQNRLAHLLLGKLGGINSNYSHDIAKV